jgi:hypothetical protein
MDARPRGDGATDAHPTDSHSTLGIVRRLLLALVLAGILGYIVELLLVEHYESATQIAPLVVLGLGLLSGAAVARRATAASLRSFRAGMGLFVVAGLAGLVLHYRGNVEFELERDPSLGGLDLFGESLHGATPALAPGAMLQLGLLGLLVTYRHPALRSARADHTPEAS